MAAGPTRPEVTVVERSGENGRAQGAEAIGDGLALGDMAGHPDARYAVMLNPLLHRGMATRTV
jgi:hypothetical protein